jgi:hypothetical protein
MRRRDLNGKAAILQKLLFSDCERRADCNTLKTDSAIEVATALCYLHQKSVLPARR